jgi:hypothetical protein
MKQIHKERTEGEREKKKKKEGETETYERVKLPGTYSNLVHV